MDGVTFTVAPEWQMLGELGWIGLEAPDEFGGGSGSFEEQSVVLEELGRAAATTSYLGGVVLGVGVLNSVEATSPRNELYRAVIAGSTKISVALACGNEAVTADVTPYRLSKEGDRLKVNGTSEFVPDAESANHLLILARTESGEPVVVHTTPTENLYVVPQPVLDGTRHLATVSVDGVEVDDSSVWRFVGEPEASIRGIADRAILAIAFDSLGLGEAMLELTVAYAREREQFGRPIGSFQAVKHACANMLVSLRIARELTVAAARALDCEATDATVLVSMAKSYASGSAVDVVGKAMQLHGGIGYTWERGIHVYLKRAMLNRSLFGSPMAHRESLGTRYG
jgi:alkylation response protein AidB-like acyl-CoA dehydrogenase